MDELLSKLDDDAAWAYPWQEGAARKEKYSVSELKKADMDEAALQLAYTDDEKPDPEVMRRAAFRGTAFHRVMELLDFKGAPEKADTDWVISMMEDMRRSGKLTAEQSEAVKAMDVVRLLESSLGQRMKAADARGKLMREVPFMAGVPVSFIDQGPALVSVHHEDEDLVIIQGVIDACFEEDGRMVIVDYKTDAVSRDEGEAVLTKLEATAWRRGESGGVQLDYDRLGRSVAAAMIPAMAGMSVQMDKQTVGRMVAPTVNREIAKDAQKRRYG
jgi:ATP-dependent helicase/nuclease subunit A